MKIKALPNDIIIHNMQKGERKVGNIILTNDDGKSSGIRTRWAQVYSVGENIDYLKEGEWILMNHGRWTRGIDVGSDDDKETFWKADPDGILAASDQPYETFAGEQMVQAEKLSMENHT